MIETDKILKGKNKLSTGIKILLFSFIAILLLPVVIGSVTYIWSKVTDKRNVYETGINELIELCKNGEMEKWRNGEVLLFV